MNLLEICKLIQENPRKIYCFKSKASDRIFTRNAIGEIIPAPLLPHSEHITAAEVIGEWEVIGA